MDISADRLLDSVLSNNGREKLTEQEYNYQTLPPDTRANTILSHLKDIRRWAYKEVYVGDKDDQHNWYRIQGMLKQLDYMVDYIEDIKQKLESYDVRPSKDDKF